MMPPQSPVSPQPPAPTRHRQPTAAAPAYRLPGRHPHNQNASNRIYDLLGHCARALIGLTGCLWRIFPAITVLLLVRRESRVSDTSVNVVPRAGRASTPGMWEQHATAPDWPHLAGPS